MTDRIRYHAEEQFPVHVKEITFRTDDQGTWTARIYQPEKEGPLPAIIDVHGGAWSLGDHTSNEPLDRVLAQSGLLVFAIGCRTAPDHPYPSQVADVSFATRWLKLHAGDFNASSQTIGGLGTSSGGHSLFLSAMRPDDPRYTVLPLPDGEETDARLSYLIGAWPVMDPYQRYLFAKNHTIDFLVDKTEGYFQTPEAMTEGNPQLALERGESLDLPPALIIEGTADENLPPESAARFVQAYCAAGGDARLALFENMPHGFALKSGPESDRALTRMKAFISCQLRGNKAI